MEVLHGIVSPVHVRHAYAADLLSVVLIDASGSTTREDLVVKLPCRANTILRPGDPPLQALRLFDEQAADGHTSDAPGPCPQARRFCLQQLRRAKAVVLHVPIPRRPDWLDSLTPGVQCDGDLWLLDPDQGPERLLSLLLIEGGHADASPEERAA